MSDRVLYFAYGANMAERVIRRRRGLTPETSEAATLAGYRLAFDLPGIRWLEPAFASVVPDPEGTVHGVLHDLKRSELERLDRFESPRYQRRSLSVTGRNRGACDAEVYVNRRPGPEHLPSRRYLELLAAGAEEHGLPQEYVAWLRSHPRGDLAVLGPFAAVALRAVALMRGGV